MTTKNVTDDVLGKFTRQQNDWFRRVREGSLDPEQVAQAVQQIIDMPAYKRNLFQKNENGHWTFSVTGMNLTGEQEITRMKEKGFRVSDYVSQVLTSTNADSYDANHHLEDDKEYRIVLVPGCEITENRTTVNIQEYARGFGYEVPLAGVMPRIREVVSDKQMEQMEIWYIAGFHAPIKDTGGDSQVLNVDRNDDGQWLDANWDDPGCQWSDHGAFAFLVPAN